MPNKTPKKLLVTTALPETRGLTESAVLAGEWCRLYAENSLWAGRRYEIVRHHWEDRGKLRNDYAYLRDLRGRLLRDLMPALNAYHGVDRPTRYWTMLLEPWLLTYVAAIWDRWECMRAAFESYGQMRSIVIDSSAVPPVCYSDFLSQVLSDRWNHRAFAEIIEYRYSGQCHLERRVADGEPASADALSLAEPSRRSLTRARLARLLDVSLGYLPVPTSAVFYQSYFSPVALARLNLRLGQVPRLYLREFDWAQIAKDLAASLDDATRDTSLLRMRSEAKTPFEEFLLGRIGRDLPAAYLEGFADLLSEASTIRLNPRVILSATGHWVNELFKVWSAERIVAGARFVAMTHGGSFRPAFGATDFEGDIADTKTVWHETKDPKHRRLPPNKLVQRRRESGKGRFLSVVGSELPRYVYRAHAGPIAGQALVGHRMVCDLHGFLPREIQHVFKVRPAPNRGWDTRQRFIDALGDGTVDDTATYDRFLSNARVIVCTYPQTTFSEAMATGRPTVLMYPDHLWETVAEQAALLDLLRAARIVFHDAEAAALHINEVWSDLTKWWESPGTVQARAEFFRQVADLQGGWLEPWEVFTKEMISDACASPVRAE